MAGSGPETAPGLSIRCVSALDAARDGDDNENDDINDNALVLTRDQLQEVYNFCNQLQGKTDDDDRLQLYAEKCNELLLHDTMLQILITTYDDIMSFACHKSKKQKTSTRAPLPAGRNKKTDDNASATNGTATLASPPTQPGSM